MDTDVRLLFAARVVRLASYGSLTVTLLLYLEALGLAPGEVGALLTAIFAGDLGVTLWLTRHADAVGRRRTLMASAALKALAGLVFGATSSLPLLALAGVVGVISPAGGEIGPFLAVEQAALAQVTTPAGGGGGGATAAAAALGVWFGWYNAAGYAALAAGALVSGWAVRAAQDAGWSALDAYRLVLHVYAAAGLLKMGVYAALSARVEVEAWHAAHGGGGGGGGATAVAATAEGALPDGAAGDDAAADDETATLVGGGGPLDDGNAAAKATPPAAASTPPPPPPPPRADGGVLAAVARAAASRMGIASPESRRIIAQLCGLFALDAWAGGLVMQSALVHWFHVRWGLDARQLGALLMGCNVAGGVSSVAAGHLVARVGAVNTMVFTHLPSNVLLALVPLMPSAPAAVGCLLLRFCLSQMDVPARQAYVASVVAPHERSAASGLTNVVRSLGVSLSPPVLALFQPGGGAGPLPGSPLHSAPFWLAALLKCVYDLSLYRLFSSTAPPLPPSSTTTAAAARGVKEGGAAEHAAAGAEPGANPAAAAGCHEAGAGEAARV